MARKKKGTTTVSKVDISEKKINADVTEPVKDDQEIIVDENNTIEDSQEEKETIVPEETEEETIIPGETEEETIVPEERKSDKPEEETDKTDKAYIDSVIRVQIFTDRGDNLGKIAIPVAKLLKSLFRGAQVPVFDKPASAKKFLKIIEKVTKKEIGFIITSGVREDAIKFFKSKNVQILKRK